jgi:hypothetical protein
MPSGRLKIAVQPRPYRRRSRRADVLASQAIFKIPTFCSCRNLHFRYGKRDGFLGSLTIGVRSSLPSATF